MLSEAIENLLDNASRYGCPNGGDVGLEVEFGDTEVVVRVADSGQGIPEDQRERVFDRFFRMSEDASGGCGLGLAIVRQVAEVHGGSARVAENTSGGAVEIRFPVTRKTIRAEQATS
jgi:two-component system sensor histidine kinase TctE